MASRGGRARGRGQGGAPEPQIPIGGDPPELVDVPVGQEYVHIEDLGPDGEEEGSVAHYGAPAVVPPAVVPPAAVPPAVAPPAVHPPPVVTVEVLTEHMQMMRQQILDELRQIMGQRDAVGPQAPVVQATQVVPAAPGIHAAPLAPVGHAAPIAPGMHAAPVVLAAPVVEQIDMATVDGFLRLHPPEFGGDRQGEDPQDFLEEIEDRLTLIHCDPLRSVELASFRLVRAASTWYKTHIRDRVTRRPRYQWEEFRQMFLDRFLSSAVREQRAREFEQLVQTPGMTVEEYERRFTDLSQYAEHLVSTEQMRIKRFIDGLVTPIHRILVSIPYERYPTVVDAARKIEARDLSDRAAREGKRGRSDDHQTSRVVGRSSGSETRSATQSSTRRDGTHFDRGFGRGRLSQTQHQDRFSPRQRQRSDSGGWIPFCRVCRARHWGRDCYIEIGACFECGQTGHFAKECPQGPGADDVSVQGPVQSVAGSESQMDSSRPPRGRGQGSQSYGGRGPLGTAPRGHGFSGVGRGGRGMTGRADGAGPPSGGRGQARLHAVAHPGTQTEHPLIADFDIDAAWDGDQRGK